MKIVLSKKNFFIVLAFFIFIAAGFGYLGYKYFSVAEKFKNARQNFEAENVQLAENIKNLENKLFQKEEELSQSEEENTQLSDLLNLEKERNDSLNEEVDSISSTVNVLEKLYKTDEELLKKYSKVYFLSENYIPDKLAEIDQKYLYEKNRTILVHAGIQKYLYTLMDDAKENGTPLQIISAYRSFGEQAALKTDYITTYGSGANKFSAYQGYSEHQLGTTVDFTTPEIAASFTKLELEPAYKWLLENAYKYGFILSYPKDNTYYQFEPWHWRFVGIILAGELHNRNQYFYDMPQREIDTYLTYIFD